ncbi:hypothetical protein NEOLEDRAFT_1100741 [Neolentinus lepideus HHB14362 ss-1]|uniref:Heterokaryon incompatibility domain-containing protein n=1 Tax=Neolentinus lepideus HHB14362 ss-1 TaxID=1314782 RepID=A0A165P2R7_9AGAM|nr:hypothetical protein NEOLEDRAFT_1100741 [Neolentinus lepideus HHB14362 ss-1]
MYGQVQEDQTHRQKILISDPGVKQLLERLVNKEGDLDFGGLYACVRNPWLWERSANVNEQYSKLIKFASHLDHARKVCRMNAFIHVHGNDLPSWHSWARRLWDLHAHRVVPYHFALRWDNTDEEFDGWSCYSAVSHSWTSSMADNHTQHFSTPVNGHEWPVPLPIGVTLEAVRNELLNLGEEYVWLDVVCLRQSGGPGEALQADEWAVDVPTIGTIYQMARKVIRYYNGLGVAFECRGWTGDRHWLRRVWTIQEIHPNSVTAGLPEGLTAEDFHHLKSEEHGRPFNHYLGPILELEDKMEWFGLARLEDLFQALKELRGRVATKRIDKIAAFGSLLHGLVRIPLYEADMDLERAWALLLQCMHPYMLAGFLWRISIPGNGRYKWRPSWTQLMHELTEESYIRDEAYLQNPALKDNFIISKQCRLLKGNAWLTLDHTDNSRPMAKVHYSDAVVPMLEFSTTLGSGQYCKEGAVRLVGNHVHNEGRHLWGRIVPGFVCLMVCKEVEISQGEIGYEKITVVPAKDLHPLRFKAEFEKTDITFV